MIKEDHIVKRLPWLAVALCSIGLSVWAQTPAQAPSVSFPFYVYKEFRARENHYIPSGWMGDYGDLQLDDHWRPAGTQDRQVIRMKYSAKGRQNNGWAGIYWQNPANNWGTKPGGYNLNGAKRVLFKARGETGSETVEQFKVGGISGDYADSGSAAVGPITLTKDWKEYEISLEGQELSSITGGFCWTMTQEKNPDGAVFYLDNIRYE